MGVPDDKPAHGVGLAGTHAGDAPAAATLQSIGLQRQPLDVAPGAEGGHHLLMGDHVLVPQLLRYLADDLRPTLITVLLLQLLDVLLDEHVDLVRVGQQVFQLTDLLDDLRVLLFQLLSLKAGKAPQLHIEDGLGLPLAQA